MTNRRDDLIASLHEIDVSAEAAVSALRVPPACYELNSVATACEPALTRLCDYHDAAKLFDAREAVRGILRLLPLRPDLTRNDYRSIDDIPDSSIDNAYSVLSIRRISEQWWRETLREALIACLILTPTATATITLLTEALRHGLPISLALRQRQNAPAVRLALLIECLTIQATEYTKLIHALTDVASVLGALTPLRKETLHPENAAELEELRRRHATPRPTISSRERLARLAREIGVAALAQRRDYHAPHAQRLPTIEMLRELVRRSSRWGEPERVALQATILLGRLGCHLLRTDNRDAHCHIERRFHETWVERRLPESTEFTRRLDGPDYAPVGHLLNIPLPRQLGDALLTVTNAGGGSQTLRGLNRKLRDLSRDSGQPVSIRRISRHFEFGLEHETPDEALMTLLGMQPQARRDAGIHYFSPSGSTLVQRFCSAIERLVDTLDLDVLNEAWSVPPGTPTQYFGYSYRVDATALRNIIATIRSKAELGRGRASPQRIIEAYNARVALLALMFLAATGSRPTGTVLPRRGDISLEDRAAIVSEKDSLGYRSTRLVTLCGRLIAEIQDFEQWVSSKSVLRRVTSADTPLAMLLAADGSFITPTISAIANVLPELSPLREWPDDMLRHLFRSRLWEMGCPSSWLRRVMGHHPPHGSADMVWRAQTMWSGLHDWSHVIDKHLDELGF